MSLKFRPELGQEKLIVIPESYLFIPPIARGAHWLSVEQCRHEHIFAGAENKKLFKLIF